MLNRANIAEERHSREVQESIRTILSRGHIKYDTIYYSSSIPSIGMLKLRFPPMNH